MRPTLFVRRLTLSVFGRKTIALVFGAALMLLLAACSGESKAASGDPAGATTATVSTAPAAVSTIGPSAVWTSIKNGSQLNPEVVRVLLNDCASPTGRNDCVEQKMRGSGASQQAIDFYTSTGWFLTDYRPVGRLGIGVILMPWRANANQQYVILNGTPALVYPETEGAKLSIVQDRAYAMLAEAFPPALSSTLDIFPADDVFETAAAGTAGVQQRFVFQYNIVNGCHACGTGYKARVAFDFDSAANYTGSSVLGICRATAATVLPGVDACPGTSP